MYTGVPLFKDHYGNPCSQGFRKNKFKKICKMRFFLIYFLLLYYSHIKLIKFVMVESYNPHNYIIKTTNVYKLQYFFVLFFFNTICFRILILTSTAAVYTHATTLRGSKNNTSQNFSSLLWLTRFYLCWQLTIISVLNIENEVLI